MKILLRVIGAVITIAAIAYAAVSVVKSGGTVLAGLSETSTWLAIALGALGYSLLSALLIYGWGHALFAASRVTLRWPEVARVFGITQIYKYLPANLFHFVARQAFLRKSGLRQSEIALGSLLESLSLMIAATAVAAVFGLNALVAMAPREVLMKLLLAVGLAGLIVLAVAGLAYMALPAVKTRIQSILATMIEPRRIAHILRALLAHLVFMIGCGLILSAISNALSIGDIPATALVAVVSAAWIVGYITPGASAGIGVRETLIIIGLSVYGVATDDATLLAVIYRAVSVAGDGLLAASAYAAEAMHKRGGSLDQTGN